MEQRGGKAGPGPERARTGSPQDVLVGTIERVTYAHETSLYCVLRLAPEKGYGPPSRHVLFAPERVTAVGKVDHPGEGLRVKLTGRWTEHRVHGWQFEFDVFEVLAPADRPGLVRYLASERFPGIGETLAKRIVEKLGARAFDEILEHPEKLDGIRGLREPIREKLVAAVRAEFGTHRSQAFLRGLGLGPVQAAAVLRKVGIECEASIRADPYRLARGIPGLGFATADKIAAGLGVAASDPRRARALLVHALSIAADEGHTLVPRPQLVDTAREIASATAAAREIAFATSAASEIASANEAAHEPASSTETAHEPTRATEAAHETADASPAAHAPADAARREPADERVSEALLDAQLLDLERANEIVLERADDGPDRVYLPALAHCENKLARNLALLLRSGPLRALATPADLARFEQRTGTTLHALQREAVLGLLSAPLGLLTGGPGVGKTTIVRALVQLARNAGARVSLASPTGRAAKRLAEATGHPAETVHRLLGYDPETSGFAHRGNNPLETDLVIVDEISMLDVVLAHHLLEAILPPARLVLVGDPNQLPSVGPGCVLHDLIASGVVPVHRLTQIYRQAEDSLIVANAHRILAGEEPVFPDRADRGGDFFFFPADDPTACAERVVDVVTRRIPERFGLDWIEDVQVIAPMYRGECGVDALNERLRQALGAGGREVRIGGRAWRTGDRVIHTRNDYEKEVFNGDMGRIVRVDADGGVVVKFPDREIGYTSGELSDLQPAFAITVHRSQGGEFPAVVVPLVPQHYMMLQRHLVYTAVTRAQKLVVIVGSRRALRMAIQNAEQGQRASALAEKLRRALESGPAGRPPAAAPGAR